MLEEIFDYLKNDFRYKRIEGDMHVTSGRLELPGGVEPAPGQFVRIFGSIYNNGVHVYDDDTLTDESWWGTVWLLAVPSDLVELAGRIRADREAQRAAEDAARESGAASVGPLKSESFDGYSYTRATRADGSLMDWRDTYRGELARWRKL